MARYNNQARSLRIISINNGWDPQEIVGDYTYDNEDRVKVGDFKPLRPENNDPVPPGKDMTAMDISAPAFEGWPEPSGSHGDPYVGMGVLEVGHPKPKTKLR